MNDKQQVLDLLTQAKHDTAPLISRRHFCTLTSLSLASLLLPGCSNSEHNKNLQLLSQEAEFKQFFDIVFPASGLGLNAYKKSAIARMKRLTDEHALYVIQFYKHFKTQLWLKRDLGTIAYNRAIGEVCMIELLHSEHAEQYNYALDIIYYELSRYSKLITALWGRKFSLTDKKCVYWDNYDQAVS